jgi:hypothetical protein
MKRRILPAEGELVMKSTSEWMGDFSGRNSKSFNSSRYQCYLKVLRKFYTG